MKKTLIALLAAATLGVSSCKKEDPLQPVEPTPTNITTKTIMFWIDGGAGPGCYGSNPFHNIINYHSDGKFIHSSLGCGNELEYELDAGEYLQVDAHYSTLDSELYIEVYIDGVYNGIVYGSNKTISHRFTNDK